LRNNCTVELANSTVQLFLKTSKNGGYIPRKLHLE